MYVALRKAPVIPSFEGDLLKSFNSTLSNSIKNYITVVVFLKEGLVQVALRMTVVIGSIVKRFKAVLYERTWSFPLLK